MAFVYQRRSAPISSAISTSGPGDRFSLYHSYTIPTNGQSGPIFSFVDSGWVSRVKISLH